MIALLPGFNAIRWMGASQPLQGLSWLPIIERVYGRNLTTRTGFVGYDRGDRYPNLSAFTTGASYLVRVAAAYELADAVAAEPGIFPAFPGYVPAANQTLPTPETPATIPGTVNTQTAAGVIIGGTLVARTAEGLVPYSTAPGADQRYLLFGFALNSALPGGAVQVQRNGHVVYPGLGLVPGATLLAGADGRIVYSNDGMAVHHVIGRATSDDSFAFSSSYTTIKLPA